MQIVSEWGINEESEWHRKSLAELHFRKLGYVSCIHAEIVPN